MLLLLNGALAVSTSEPRLVPVIRYAAWYCPVGITTLAPNANIVFDQGGSVTTTTNMAANTFQATTVYVKGVTAGTGSVTITGGRFATYTNTLTVTP